MADDAIVGDLGLLTLLTCWHTWPVFTVSLGFTVSSVFTVFAVMILLSLLPIMGLSRIVDQYDYDHGYDPDYQTVDQAVHQFVYDHGYEIE